MLHFSSPMLINNVYKIIESILWELRSILSCENAASTSVSGTESKRYSAYDVAETSDLVLFAP